MDRLGEVVALTGNLVHFLGEFLDQLLFCHSRPPLVAGFEHDERVSETQWHRVRGDLGGPTAGEHGGHFGDFQHLLLEGRHKPNCLLCVNGPHSHGLDYQ